MKVSPIVLLFILSLVAISLATPNSTASTGQSVLVLNLHEEIDPGSSHFISSALSGVNRNNTVAVVIDMNTPGGILQNMLDIINAINATQARGVPVYTYVPSYGGAASAGSYIALASTAVP